MTESLEDFRKRIHDEALAKLKKKHDSDGLFYKAPHHIWGFSSEFEWDKIAMCYTYRERCAVCGEEKNVAVYPSD